MKKIATVFLLVAAGLMPCSGAVVYQLVGTSGVISPSFSENFQATTPSFIAANTTLPAASLDACTTGLDACMQVVFEPVSTHDPGSASIEFFTNTTSTLYFFAPGSFAAPGVYNTTFGAGSGTLTVSASLAAVPEPSTVFLILPGALALIASRRLRP